MNDVVDSMLDKLETWKSVLDEAIESLNQGITDMETGIATFDEVVRDIDNYFLIGKPSCAAAT